VEGGFFEIEDQIPKQAMNGKGGRPRKNEDEKRDDLLPIQMPPSGKRIVRQEADRCGATMTKIVERHAKQMIAPTERRMPIPKIYDWILDRARQMQEKASEQKEEWLIGDMETLIGLITSKAATLAKRREKRKEWREKMQEERLSAQIGYRVTGQLREWYESKADGPVTTMIRRKTLKGIRHHEKMEKGENWFKGWKKSISRALEKNSRGKELRESINTIGYNVERRTKEEFYNK